MKDQLNVLIKGVACMSVSIWPHPNSAYYANASGQICYKGGFVSDTLIRTSLA